MHFHMDQEDYRYGFQKTARNEILFCGWAAIAAEAFRAMSLSSQHILFTHFPRISPSLAPLTRQRISISISVSAFIYITIFM